MHIKSVEAVSADRLVINGVHRKGCKIEHLVSVNQMQYKAAESEAGIIHPSLGRP